MVSDLQRNQVELFQSWADQQLIQPERGIAYPLSRPWMVIAVSRARLIRALDSYLPQRLIKVMSKLRLIQDFHLAGYAPSAQTLLSAFVACLIPAETCQALDLTFTQTYEKRRAIVNKIVKDASSDIEDCHLELVDSLIELLEELPYAEKQKCAYCLSQLYESMSSNVKTLILKSMIGSDYKGVRKRGYKKLRNDWNPNFESVILKSWEENGDEDCAKLVIENFPVECLLDMFDELEERVERTWHFTKLYLRVAEIDPGKLKKLARKDGITYAYIMTKLSKSLKRNEALDIFQRYTRDERIGLLIWCFGQMKLWEVLEEIYNGELSHSM